MSVLFYSNYCDHSKKLLQILNKTKINKDINFVCIDNRAQKQDGMYIQFQNGQELLLPSIVNKVPALLLINQGNNVLYGEKIYQYLQPIEQHEVAKATKNNFEPSAFNLGEMGGMSDNYSYWEATSDDLLAKGTGGTQMMHGYADLNFNGKIETPDENYKPDKIGEVSLDKLVQERNIDIKR
jgi:hypothetical protein